MEQNSNPGHQLYALLHFDLRILDCFQYICTIYLYLEVSVRADGTVMATKWVDRPFFQCLKTW